MDIAQLNANTNTAVENVGTNMERKTAKATANQNVATAVANTNYRVP